MSEISLGLGGIGVLLLILFLTDIPVAFVMALVGTVGFALAVSWKAALATAGSAFWQIFSSYGLSVVPFFILMGNICFHTGVSRRLYSCAYAWFGHIKGGIAIATVFACAGFAAICGSNAATAATMSAVALPEMKRLGYSPQLSSGAVSAGSTLGVVIPPSVVLIVIGLATEQSIAKLFFASFVPGLLLTLLMAVTVLAVCLANPDAGPPGPRQGWRERFATLPGSIEMLFLFTVVMTGLYLGWFTPTEAGAAGSFFALIIVALSGNLTLMRLKTALYDTLKTSCMIYMIIAGAVIFGRFLSVTRLPFEAAAWVSSLDVPREAVLLIMLAIYVVGGAIMDSLGFLMISLPIFFPIAKGLGYDPLWFSVVITIITTLGAITPPVGITTYIVAGMDAELRLEYVFQGVAYFFAAFLLTLIALYLFPGLVTWLPGLV